MLPAAILLWGVAALSRHAKPAIVALKDKYIALVILVASIAGPFVGVWLSIVAVKYTEAGIASTLLATVPILLIPMEFFIHKRVPSWRGVLGAVLAVVGVALIFMR